MSSVINFALVQARKIAEAEHHPLKTHFSWEKPSEDTTDKSVGSEAVSGVVDTLCEQNASQKRELEKLKALLGVYVK